MTLRKLESLDNQLQLTGKDIEKFEAMLKTSKELSKEKEVLLNKVKKEKTEHQVLLEKVNPDIDLTRVPAAGQGRPRVRTFVHKISIVCCNRFYNKTRQIYSKISDLKWVRADERNARALIEMLDIKA